MRTKTERAPRDAGSRRTTTTLEPDNPVATLNQIYAAHRIAGLNASYMAWKVDQITGWTQVYEGALAVATALTAGSGLSNLVFLPNGWVKSLTAGFACVAALLAAIKPTIGLSKRLEVYTKQYAGYQHLFAQLDKNVREIAEAEFLGPRAVEAWNLSKERNFDLKASDPTYVNRTLLDRLQNEMLRRYPDGYYWAP